MKIKIALPGRISDQVRPPRRVRLGRILLLIVALIVATSSVAIFHIAAHTSFAAPVHSAVTVSAIWCLALMAATWFRAKGARTALALLLFVGAGAQLLFLPDVLAEVPGLHTHHFLAFTTSAFLLSSLSLALLRPLRRLNTRRSPFYFYFHVPVFAPYYRGLVR